MTPAQVLRIVIVAPDSLAPSTGDAWDASEVRRSRSLRIGLLENGYNIVAVLPADMHLLERLAQIAPVMGSVILLRVIDRVFWYLDHHVLVRQDGLA